MHLKILLFLCLTVMSFIPSFASNLEGYEENLINQQIKTGTEEQLKKNPHEIFFQGKCFTLDEVKYLTNLLKSKKLSIKLLELWNVWNLNDEVCTKGCKEIATALIENTNLLILRLIENGICAPELTELNKSLQNNTTLTELNFALNDIDDDKCIEEIVKLILNNKTIKILNFINNEIYNKGAEKILRNLKFNYMVEEINLDNNLIDDTTILDKINHCLAQHKVSSSIEKTYLTIKDFKDINFQWLP